MRPEPKTILAFGIGKELTPDASASQIRLFDVFMQTMFYECPTTKLREGNVFGSVCPSICLHVPRDYYP